jgi:hypothetical protein
MVSIKRKIEGKKRTNRSLGFVAVILKIKSCTSTASSPSPSSLSRQIFP